VSRIKLQHKSRQYHSDMFTVARREVFNSLSQHMEFFLAQMPVHTDYELATTLPAASLPESLPLQKPSGLFSIFSKKPPVQPILSRAPSTVQQPSFQRRSSESKPRNSLTSASRSSLSSIFRSHSTAS
jgi:hypothetical protein